MAEPRKSSPASVIVRRGLPGGHVQRSWRDVLPPWLVSCVFHFLLLCALLLPRYMGVRLALFSGGESKQPEEPPAINTLVGEEERKENLENDEIGNDPSKGTNYDLGRPAPVSVMGPVKLAEKVGRPGGTDPIPSTLPPAPGFGRGSGGGIDAAEPGMAPLGIPGGLGGPLMKPGGFDGRSGGTRERMVTEGGGNGPSEAAVAAGLKWIHLHQAPDGHWALDEFSQHGQRQAADGTTTAEKCNCTGRGVKNDIAGTAFGLLPLLGAGETHRDAEGKRLYTKDVERGLKYLILKQHRDGGWGGEMYSQGLATIALCEAYGMTSDPGLREPAQRAINYIVQQQHKDGGWVYNPTYRGPHDTSVGGWQLMALKSGQLAGLDVDPKAFAGAARWLDDVSSLGGSGYGYVKAEPPTPAMTAVGLLCREYMGWGPRNPALIKGAQRLLAESPPRVMHNIYYYYYATQVMHHIGIPELWDAWNLAMRDWLIETQDRGVDPRQPHHKGSWDPRGDRHGVAGGRLMVTSMAVLTLEVYYRHLPLYHRGIPGMN